jgi:hypothetical protein
MGSVFGIASILGAQYTSFGANNYRVYDADYNWIEIKDTGIKITDFVNAGDTYTTITSKFYFPFYRQNYNALFLSTNGHIDFTNGSGNINYNSYGNKIPAKSYSIDKDNNWGENPLIAFFFCGLSFDSSWGNGHGNAYYQDFGDYLVIEFEEVAIWWDEDSQNPDEGTHTMEVILYKNGNIKMQYKSISYQTDWYGNPAIIGLDLDANTGVSYDGPIRNGLALWFTTGADPDPKTLPITQILKILKGNQED